jgi:hypothetical protein
MKNQKTTERFFIVFLLTICLILLLGKVANGDTRRGRILDSPQAIIPNAKLVPNKFGGHNYYVQGKIVGYSRKNVHDSYDIYIKGRLKYRGASFKGTHTFTPTPPSTQRTYKSALHNKPRQRVKAPSSIMSTQQRDAYVKRWRAQRAEQSKSKTRIWEHLFPGRFDN